MRAHFSSSAFFSRVHVSIHATLVGTTHRVLTEISGLCRHSDSSSQSVPFDILSVIRNASLIFYNSIACTVMGYSIIIIEQQACDLTCWFRGTKRAVSGTDWNVQAELLVNAFFVFRMRAGAKLLIKYA